jgi:hypothetical protein
MREFGMTAESESTDEARFQIQYTPQFFQSQQSLAADWDAA